MLLAPHARAAVLPAIRRALDDARADVRLRVLEQLDVVCAGEEGEKIASQLLPVVLRLTGDQHWRVREAIVQKLPSLSKTLVRSPPAHAARACPAPAPLTIPPRRTLPARACGPARRGPSISWTTS